MFLYEDAFLGFNTFNALPFFYKKEKEKSNCKKNKNITVFYLIKRSMRVYSCRYSVKCCISNYRNLCLSRGKCMGIQHQHWNKRKEGKRETETEWEAVSQSNSVPVPSVTITDIPKRPGLERPLQLMSTGERWNPESSYIQISKSQIKPAKLLINPQYSRTKVQCYWSQR